MGRLAWPGGAPQSQSKPRELIARPSERLDARLNTEAGARPDKRLDARLDTKPEAQPQKRFDAPLARQAHGHESGTHEEW